jgi:hypothetical protein
VLSNSTQDVSGTDPVIGDALTKDGLENFVNSGYVQFPTATAGATVISDDNGATLDTDGVFNYGTDPGVATGTARFAQGAGAGNGIIGTPHDLSRNTNPTLAAKYGSDDHLDRICIFCHAPHHTLKVADAAGINYLPLWNHGVTSVTYITYGNGTDDPSDENHDSYAEENAGQPGSVSRLCLSCHDGTVAVNEYGFDPGRLPSRGAASHSIQGSFAIGAGGNLWNHHPIGFDYNAAEATDDELADSNTQFGDTGVTIQDLLYAGKMECVTCHDVHNTKNEGETFLWVSDYNSRFCCTCHLKCTDRATDGSLSGTAGDTVY